MALNPEPSYSTTRHFMVKLHRDARPERGELFGKLEHVVTSESVAFASSTELLSALARLASEPRPHDDGAA